MCESEFKTARVGGTIRVIDARHFGSEYSDGDLLRVTWVDGWGDVYAKHIDGEGDEVWLIAGEFEVIE